jgi:hypothetical protein
MKNTTIVVSLLVIIGLIIGIYFFTKDSSDLVVTDDTVTSTDTTSSSTDQATAPVNEKQTIIGSSLEKRDIVAYNYGTGEKNILFVGGIHGGYEWNTSLLAYELMDYLEANPNLIPQDVRVTVIPVLNPDGLNKVVGTAGRFAATDVSNSAETVIEGRFNSRGVDLNRNFDCGWQVDGVWQKMKVSGGSQVFSEPESQAIKNYVTAKKPSAVVVWYSAAGGVFSSNCQQGILPETSVLTNVYASASGYKPYESFDFYETSGDMVNWLAKEKIPAISVILTDHQNTEWSKNLAGIKALLNYYSK